MRHFRRGYTLIELMAVLVILGVLMTLAMLWLPLSSDRRAADLAAQRVQSWLSQAKVRAATTQRPTGIRFVKSNTNSLVDTLEFIEQPEPFVPTQANGKHHTLRLFNNGNPTSPQLNARIVGYRVNNIKSGDYLELSHGTLSVHRIDAANITAAGTDLTLFNSVDEARSSQLDLTDNWRIIRQPLPLIGEQLLLMPKDTGIDWTMNQPAPVGYDRPLPPYILFSPAGSLIDCPSGRVALWVRHAENKGTPTIIAISGRNGSVGAFPVDDRRNANGQIVNPWTFCDDGFGAGL